MVNHLISNLKKKKRQELKIIFKLECSFKSNNKVRSLSFFFSKMEEIRDKPWEVGVFFPKSKLDNLVVTASNEVKNTKPNPSALGSTRQHSAAHSLCFFKIKIKIKCIFFSFVILEAHSFITLNSVVDTDSSWFVGLVRVESFFREDLHWKAKTLSNQLRPAHQLSCNFFVL